jgi:flavorubredoxin
MDSYYTTLETRKQDELGQYANQRGQAWRSLFDEFLDAFMSDPCQAIRTPGYSDHHQQSSLADLFAEELADDVLAELMLMLRDAARGEDVRLRAILLRNRIAKKHADYHADDLANQMEDNQ